MQLNHQRNGNGPTLIVMHGLFGNLSNWKTISRKLSDEFDVISVDLRNHGRSPWDNDVSYPSMAGDILELMEAQGIAEAGLVGHSMGGKTAMTLSLQNSERVSGLVVVDIAPVIYQHSHIDLINTLLAVDLNGARNRQQVDEQLAEYIPEAGLRMFLSQNLVFQEGTYGWRINLPALAQGMSSLTGFPTIETASFDNPALFLYGKASDYVTDNHHSTIHHLFTDSKLIGIHGAGHWVHAEAADQVSENIREFFNTRVFT